MQGCAPCCSTLVLLLHVHLVPKLLWFLPLVLLYFRVLHHLTCHPLFRLMAAAVVVRRGSHFQATHFLGLPLCNSKSRSQPENFAHELRNDEYAEGIPHRTFRFPASFHLNVVDLILESDRDVKAASNLLRRLDIERILKESATATAAVRINEKRDNEDSESVACRRFVKK